MADQGPLVRVDTDGRGTLIKMTRKQAEEFVSRTSGASIVGGPETPAPAEEVPEPSEPTDGGEPEAPKSKASARAHTRG